MFVWCVCVCEREREREERVWVCFSVGVFWYVCMFFGSSEWNWGKKITLRLFNLEENVTHASSDSQQPWLHLLIRDLCRCQSYRKCFLIQPTHRLRHTSDSTQTLNQTWYFYIYMPIVSQQKWVHPSHFCKYFIYFHVTTLKKLHFATM